MPRPKQNDPAPTARDRMAQAFWKLMEHMPYDKISVRQIVRLAHVNHNTFYYHFSSIDDMATQLIEDTACEALVPYFLTNRAFSPNLPEGLSLPADIEARFHHMGILVKNGNAFITDQVKSLFIKHWLEAAGRKIEDLSKGERLQLEFIIGGMLAVRGSVDSLQEGFAVISCLNTPLFAEVFASLRRMRDAR